MSKIETASSFIIVIIFPFTYQADLVVVAIWRAIRLMEHLLAFYRCPISTQLFVVAEQMFSRKY